MPSMKDATTSKLPAPRRSFLFLTAGTLTLMALNLWFRASLDGWSHTSYKILPADFAQRPWRVLLPFDLSEGETAAGDTGCVHWFTTGLVTLNLIESQLGSQRAFYLLNAMIIASSATTGWLASRSIVFALTFALCLGFGTQFLHGYLCPSVFALYLFAIYLQWNLTALLRWVTHPLPHPVWRVVYLVSLLLLALSHEQWLDYLAFQATALGFTIALGWRWAKFAPRFAARARAARQALAFAVCLAIVYLSIRLSFGTQQRTPGQESEMIFSYAHPTLMAEDFVSNVFTYLYISFTNFLPPWFLASMSDYRLGRDVLIQEQHGYHGSMSHLVGSHHMFLWHFYAGAVASCFFVALFKNARHAWRTGSDRSAGITALLLLIACGFAIHSVVKFRPYLSVPLLSYRCMTSVVGVAALIALGLTAAKDRMNGRITRWAYAPLVAMAWGLLLYASLARPHYLSHLSRQVGFGDYADPMANLAHKAQRWMGSPRSQSVSQP